MNSPINFFSTSFQPTAAMIKIAVDLRAKMAYEQTVRQQVVAYQTRILAKHRFKLSRFWVARGIKDRVVLDPSHTYLLSCKSFKAYCKATAKEARKAGFKVPNGCCPLLMAENAVRLQQYELVDILIPITGQTQAQLMQRPNGLEAYGQYIQLYLDALAPNA